jgi:asparagine synthase (glutamine-hydrolysing)
MCGLFGVVYRDGETLPSQRRLEQSIKLLSHRGPDGSGIYHEPGIGLAHSRLALLDLDPRSDQPFWDPTGRYCLLYNGEIYNFTELKGALAKRGAQFRTSSDTEVVLWTLILDGPDATLRSLQGMFAFAFYDRVERRLVLARDRFGIKPLHLYRDGQLILISSEVKAMGPWVSFAPNPHFVISYLIQMRETARNASIFANVEILPPGTVLEIAADGREERRTVLELTDFLDPDQAEELRTALPARAVDRFDQLLNESISKMLVADAPVGALCSGGVDSALLLAIASRHHDNLAIFHADVQGDDSEFKAAARLAKHLRLELKKVETGDEHFLALMPRVIYHYERPFIQNPHSVPFLMVSELVRDSGIKAVLTGEGSDECFIGYPRLVQEPFWRLYEKLMDKLRRAVQRIPAIGQNLWNSDGRTGLLIGAALTGFEREMDANQIRQAAAQSGLGADRSSTVTLEEFAFLLRRLLHRNDAMGMAASVEARFPMLYEPLAKAAVNLPYDRKVRRSARFCTRAHPFHRDKWVLRQVARRYLPTDIAERKKEGFYVNSLNRLRVGREFFRNSFLGDFLSLSEPELDHLYGQADRRLIVKMAMLEVWADLFCTGGGEGRALERLSHNASFPQLRAA